MNSDELVKWLFGLISGLTVGGVFIWVRGITVTKRKNDQFREDVAEFKGAIIQFRNDIKERLDRIDNKIDNLPCKHCEDNYGSDRVTKASLVK